MIRPGTLSLLAAMFLLGCAGGSVEPLSQLPGYRLDVKGPPASGQPGRAAPAADPAAGRWAVANPRPWRYIVIHHSASPIGNAKTIGQAHRDRGFDEMGYHFVIDNGQGGPDGLVEVGGRWTRQKWGAHTGNTPDNDYNNFGIGICLVGDFARNPPTAAQLDSLQALTSYLVRQYDIPPDAVIGHRDAPSANTECPGDRLYQYLQTVLRPLLARQYMARR